jgi:hypothetical protein
LSDIHITRELLRAVARGELSARKLAQIEGHHLESLCPVCRREVQAWREEQTAATGYEYALQALPAVLGRHASDLLKQSRQAKRDLEELLAIPPAERLARIARARSRFRGPVLAERLIRESRRRTPADPREGYDLAELARIVVYRSADHPDNFALLALASAQMANACRAGGDLRQAGEHFLYVRSLVSREDVTDPIVLAQIDHLEGSLRKDQRRFEEAEALLTRAAMLFQISGAAVETAAVLWAPFCSSRRRRDARRSRRRRCASWPAGWRRHGGAGRWRRRVDELGISPIAFAELASAGSGVLPRKGQRHVAWGASPR